jgi:segregation and condensation protein A
MMEDPEQNAAQLELQYEVKLEAFEGPLDLLLHLVRKHELDILQIPIAFITEQYLGYLDLMKSLNLDIAGEFLYYAALLAHIKSKQMLPPEDEEEEAEGESDEERDPAKVLKRRLLDYQRFREAAEFLDTRPVVGRSVFLRGAENPFEGEGESVRPFAEVTLFQLIDAFAKVLARARPEMMHDVVVDRISLADRMGELMDRLRETPRMTFTSTFSHIPLGPGFKIQVVVTFLAILEMVRQRILRVHQPEAGTEIYLERALAVENVSTDELKIDDTYA